MPPQGRQDVFLQWDAPFVGRFAGVVTVDSTALPSTKSAVRAVDATHRTRSLSRTTTAQASEDVDVMETASPKADASGSPRAPSVERLSPPPPATLVVIGSRVSRPRGGGGRQRAPRVASRVAIAPRQGLRGEGFRDPG